MDYFDHFCGLSAKKHYDEQNALSLAIVCDLAYTDDTQIKSTVASWGFHPLDVITRTKGRDIDTQCFIMSDDDNIVVAFRGSDAKEDWLANIQIFQDPGPFANTGVHEGFQDSLFPTAIALTRHVRDAEIAHKRIWITGHSLGGALCSLYAGMLIENGLEVYAIYTFASPRPGDANFGKQLNQRVIGPHFRVVNDGDIVPHLPPEPFFSHPGKRIILKSTRKERSKSSWLNQRISALKHFVKITGEKFDVADIHRLTADSNSYIPRLIKDRKRASR